MGRGGWTRWVLGGVVAVGLTAGCGPVVPIGGEDEGTSDASTSDSSDGTSGSVPPNPSSPSTTSASTATTFDDGVDTTSDDGTSSVDSVGFICLQHCQPDGGNSPFECDVWAQDCPEGEKCSAWANDGGNAWNATKCTPIDPNPDGVGEPCTVEGSGVSGIDSCALGAMCWAVDPDTNEGTCVGLCQGSDADPICPGCSSCFIGNDGALNLCFPACDPIAQDCGPGQGCYDFEGAFSCLPAAGRQTPWGEPCDFEYACSPGQSCRPPSEVPGCQGSIGCCTLYCDTGNPIECDLVPGTMCSPLEVTDPECSPTNVGVCLLP